MLLNYWKSRRASPYKKWGIETWFSFYFEWMDKFQFDDYLQRSLLLDLMELCKYQKLEYFNHDRLLKLKKDLLKKEVLDRVESNQYFTKNITKKSVELKDNKLLFK